MTNLEQSFADLIAEHDLIYASLAFHASSICFTLQWSDVAQDHGRGISMEHGDTVAAALGKAVADMKAKRNLAEPIEFADEALPELADV